MNKEQKQIRILAFVSFCIEEYKNRHSMDGKAVADLFEKAGILEYLFAHYELLHTFSRDAILSDIEQFLSERGRK